MTSSCRRAPGGAPTAQAFAAAQATAIAIAPTGGLFYAERAGRITYVTGSQVHPFASVSTVTAEPGGGYSERGLLGLAVSQSFASDGYVFAFYSGTDYAHQYVVRWRECDGTGTAVTTLITLPSGGDCCHKGGRLAISPDNLLYVTLGDEHTSSAAQVAGDPRGKVLRYNLDGVPTGSPWVSGLRNPFGIAFAPDGTLALTNNGPSGDAGTPCGGCGDEFYLVGRGGGMDYQWPYCWGYSNSINGQNCHGLPEPQFSTERTGLFVAPTGMTYASSGAYAGHFLFCAYGGGRVWMYNGPHNVTQATALGSCSYDIKQGTDGAIWTSDGSGLKRH